MYIPQLGDMLQAGVMRTAPSAELLARAALREIDVYVDIVGGEQLPAALEVAARKCLRRRYAVNLCWPDEYRRTKK